MPDDGGLLNSPQHHARFGFPKEAVHSYRETRRPQEAIHWSVSTPRPLLSGLWGEVLVGQTTLKDLIFERTTQHSPELQGQGSRPLVS